MHRRLDGAAIVRSLDSDPASQIPNTGFQWVGVGFHTDAQLPVWKPATTFGLLGFGAKNVGVRCPQSSRWIVRESMNTQSAVARRGAEARLRALVARFAPAHERLVGTARRWLRKRLPTAHEVVYGYRDNFVISFSPNEHGYAGVFALRGDVHGVRLYFNQGKGLPDSEKLLQGSGSLVRWIPLESAATLKHPAVVALVDAALARNRVPFAATGRGPVIIQSLGPKPPLGSTA
jgi:hypothetical protein